MVPAIILRASEALQDNLAGAKAGHVLVIKAPQPILVCVTPPRTVTILIAVPGSKQRLAKRDLLPDKLLHSLFVHLIRKDAALNQHPP